MSKSQYLEAGNGKTTGPWGSEMRQFINDLVPGQNAFMVPETFNWTASLSAYANRVMIVTYQHTVSGAITLPAGCMLLFFGGSLLSVTTITGNMSRFENPYNSQIFSNTTNFAGTWTNSTIKPTDLGAIPNSAVTVIANGCAAAFQKCFDSQFDVTVLPAFYYIESELYITKNKVVRMGEKIWDYGPLANTERDHVRLYTDQNINVITIGSTDIQNPADVSLLGGIIDCTQVAAHTKAAIRYDINKFSWGGRITTAVRGNRTALYTTGVGTIGVDFDTSTPSVDYGYACSMHIDNVISYCAKGVWVRPPVSNPLYYHQWITALNIYPELYFCKQPYLIENGSLSKILGHIQPGYVLNEEEKDLPCVTLNYSNLTYGPFHWDLSPLPDEYGHYTNSIGTVNNGNNRFVGDAETQSAITKVRGSGQFESPRNVWNEGRPIFMDDRWDLGAFIDYFDNQLSFWGQRPSTSFTVKAHEGTGYDFDAHLGETAQAETSDIELDNEANLFKRTGLPFIFRHLNTADLDNDFVEIVITGSLSLVDFLIYVRNIGTATKRIQVITETSGGTKAQFNFYNPEGIVLPGQDYIPYTGLKLFHNTLGTGIVSVKTVVRFIGAMAANGDVIVNSIAARATTRAFCPVITPEGGQEIYGKLTMASIKLRTTPVYANNAAALSGGLTAGDIYRTSAGVLMEVI